MSFQPPRGGPPAPESFRGRGSFRGGRGRGGFRGGGRFHQGRGGRGRHHRGGRGGRWNNGPPRRHGSDSFDRIEEIGTPSDTTITIAIEGCCHGELDAIYASLHLHQQRTGQTIDLLLCCGDFQSLRNTADFHSLAVPAKYRALGSFYLYYAGMSVAPVLTIFVGGNHEASQPLQELTYGGWVAPNIYYLGAAGVVHFGGLRIGGISGIYKPHDYELGHFERPPYDKATLRSVYHVRSVDVYRMKCLASAAKKEENRPCLDVMVSHDWPQGIEQHGDTQALLRQKPFFRDEVRTNSLGSPANRELLDALQPKWWFAAHLHVKFQAQVRHGAASKASTDNDEARHPSLVPSQTVHAKPASTATKESPPSDKQFSQEKEVNVTPATESETAPDDGKSKEEEAETTEATTQFLAPEVSSDSCPASGQPSLTDLMTRFLSLDKCLPRRQCLSILHLPVSGRQENPKLEYDPEWLAILRKTHSLSTTDRRRVDLPADPESVTTEEVDWVRQRLGESMIIPENFRPTVPAHAGPPDSLPHPLPPPIPLMGNPQTDQLLDLLQLEHVLTIPFHESQLAALGGNVVVDASVVVDENEIEIDRVGDDVVDGPPVAVDENEIEIDSIDNDEAGDVVTGSGAKTQLESATEQDENEIDLDDEASNGDDRATTKKPRVGSL